MKLLFVTTGLNIGGAERAMHTIINNGLSERYIIKIISLRDIGHYGEKFESDGIEICCLNLQNPLNLFLSILKAFNFARGFEPDVIQGWMYHGNIFSLLFGRFTRAKPKVYWGIRQTLYDIRKEKVLTQLIIRLEAKLSFFADGIIYNSKKSQNQHESIGFSKKNSIYIPNGFDLSIWKPDAEKRKALRKELEIPDNSFVIGYIGRFHQMKNIGLLFEVMESVLSENTNSIFLVVGENTDRENLKLKSFYDRLPPQQIVSLGVRVDIPAVVQCIDLLCLTSAWGEGFPNVIGEAMATGIPCVATDIGDSALVIGETGWIIPPNNVELLANCINVALSESTSAHNSRSVASKKVISENYNITHIVDNYNNVYLHNQI
jgi:glycosyltransferase involved in cell wall biosynthesis